MSGPIRGRRGEMIPVDEYPSNFGYEMHRELDAIAAEQRVDDVAEAFLNRTTRLVWPLLVVAVVVFLLLVFVPRPPVEMPAPVTGVQLPTIGLEP